MYPSLSWTQDILLLFENEDILKVVIILVEKNWDYMIQLTIDNMVFNNWLIIDIVYSYVARLILINWLMAFLNLDKGWKGSTILGPHDSFDI
jgi:hypothetical protein